MKPYDRVTHFNSILTSLFFNFIVKFSMTFHEPSNYYDNRSNKCNNCGAESRNIVHPTIIKHHVLTFRCLIKILKYGHFLFTDKSLPIYIIHYTRIITLTVAWIIFAQQRFSLYAQIADHFIVI